MAGFLGFTAVVIYLLIVSDPKYVGIDISELNGGSEIRLHKLELRDELDKVNRIKDADSIIAAVPGSADEIYFAPKAEQKEGPAFQKKGEASSPAEIINEEEATKAVAGNKLVNKAADERIGFFKAWTLHKVALYACFFFTSKMAVYCLIL